MLFGRRCKTEGDACRTLDPGGYLPLSVADNGAGMAADVMERIFDSYVTTKDVDRGLSVVRGIVKAHDGAIDIRSQPGGRGG